MEDFLCILAQNFKEPLRLLKSHQLAIMGDGHNRFSEKSQKHLQSLGETSTRLGAMIEALQDYCSIGLSEKAFMETNLNSILQKAVQALGIDLAEGQVELIVHGKLPWLPCDKKLIRELFRHLLANAIQYNTRPRKKIEVGLATALGLRFELPARVRGEVFFIRDNGMGIRKKHQHNLFKPFQRCHTQQKYGPGLGMGLALSKKIVEYHGGRIWLETIPGRSTTVFFTLS